MGTIGNIKEFLDEHKGLVIGALILFVVLLLVVGTVRQRNAKKAYDEQMKANQAQTEVDTTPTTDTVNNLDDSEYKHELGIDADKGDGRVAINEEDGKVEEKQEVKQIDPSYTTQVRVFDFQKVPDTMVDGSDIKGYLSRVNLDMFGSMWGKKLTSDDFYSSHRTLVGVKQEAEDFERGDLQSVGWLINNLSSLPASEAIKFTNLHVVGNLADDHNACLCCYDWYSAFGIDDTLVVFEDISGKVDNFKAGDIFSCTVYAHNVKIERVNGQNVVCIQYTSFKKNKEY